MEKCFFARPEQLPEIRTYFPNVNLKFLIGGHNLGLTPNTFEPFMEEVLSFIQT